ncbi:MAG: peptidoglycan recognition protein, partial [Actinomycetota bacterium]|nr:peptidoglycan recognition protein [Actinomycetota bacterium]
RVFPRVVKRLLVTSALVCALALAVVAAPALSSRPYRPEPVQFSMPAAGSDSLLGNASRRGPGVVSRPLRAPRRFNAVGLTWRGELTGPGIAVRTRLDGGEWTPWSTMATHAEDAPDPGGEPAPRGVTSPTWAGEADWVQYRSSRRLAGLRFQFINVRGTATAADRAKTAVRRAAGAGVATLATVLAPGSASAAAEPSMVSRAEWGASKCRPRSAPEIGEVDAAFVHHTVNNNDYTRDEAPDVVLAICLFHRNTNGWNDIGYNFLVDRFGTLYEGRAGGTGKPVVGAHAVGYNAQATGIANLGTFSEEQQSPAALRSLAALIRWKLPLHGAPTTGSVDLVSTGGATNRYPAGRKVRLQRVSGHRDTGATECPGEALYAQLGELRRLVAGARPAPGAITQLDAEVKSADTVSLGTPVQLSGSLTDERGTPLAGQPVDVQALVGTDWRTASTQTTDSQGGFSALVKLRRNRSLRASFPGAGGRLPTASAPVAVKVRPVVTLTQAPVTGTTGRRTVLAGKVRPRKRSVWQVLQVRRGHRWRVVSVKRLRVGRDRTFRGSFVPAGSKRYRYYVTARADSVTARGASQAYQLRVGGPGTGDGGVVAPSPDDVSAPPPLIPGLPQLLPL